MAVRMPLRAKTAARVNTRDRIIAVAEQLFAQRGFSAVSLREIGVASDQRNPSVVHYHFGSKQGLIDAILDHRQFPINERRLRRLEELERAGRSRELRALVEALVYPLLESLQPGSTYARFVAEVLNDPIYGAQPEQRRVPVREGYRRIEAGIRSIMRGVPQALRTRRIVLATKLLFRGLADHERELEGRTPVAISTAALGSDLVEMIIGLIAAPLSARTQRLLRARPPRSRSSSRRRHVRGKKLP